jgi:hypothetical protein
MAMTSFWVRSFAVGLACLAGAGSLGWTQAQAELLQVKLTGSLTTEGKNGGGVTTPFAGSFDVDTSVGLEHVLNLTGYPDGAISNVSISAFGFSFSAADIVDFVFLDPQPTSPALVSLEDLQSGATPSIGISFQNGTAQFTFGSVQCGRNDCIIPNDLAFASGDGTLFAQGSFSASVVAATPTVPEPSTWGMLLLGFAGLGLAGYRQTRKVRVARSELAASPHRD